jgi:hypothetical protein
MNLSKSEISVPKLQLVTKWLKRFVAFFIVTAMLQLGFAWVFSAGTIGDELDYQWILNIPGGAFCLHYGNWFALGIITLTYVGSWRIWQSAATIPRKYFLFMATWILSCLAVATIHPFAWGLVGMIIPHSPAIEACVATTYRFSPSFNLANFHELTIGSQRHDVIASLGSPQRESRDEILYGVTNYDDDGWQAIVRLDSQQRVMSKALIVQFGD